MDLVTPKRWKTQKLKANVIPIVVLNGHLNQKEAEELGVEHIIENVTELGPILHQINNQS